MTKILKLIAVVSLLFFTLVPSIHAAGVNLAWDAPAEGGAVEGYKIYWKTGSGSYGDANSMNVVGKNSETVSGLDESKTYNFIVKAYNSAGEGPSSNEVEWSYSDSTPPLQVMGVKAQ